MKSACLQTAKQDNGRKFMKVSSLQRTRICLRKGPQQISTAGDCQKWETGLDCLILNGCSECMSTFFPMAAIISRGSQFASFEQHESRTVLLNLHRAEDHDSLSNHNTWALLQSSSHFNYWCRMGKLCRFLWLQLLV